MTQKKIKCPIRSHLCIFDRKHLWLPGNSWVPAQSEGRAGLAPSLDTGFPYTLHPARVADLGDGAWPCPWTSARCAEAAGRVNVSCAVKVQLRSHRSSSISCPWGRHAVNYAFLIDLPKPLLPFFAFHVMPSLADWKVASSEGAGVRGALGSDRPNACHQRGFLFS